MNTTTKLQTLVTQLSSAFERKTRVNGESFVCLKDDSPGWMQDVIRECHNGSLPDDTIYDVIEECADKLAEYEGDELIEAIYEIEADIYNSDLTNWLSKSLNHIGYVDQAMEEQTFTSITEAIQAGQLLQINEIGMQLIQELEDLDLDEETED